MMIKVHATAYSIHTEDDHPLILGLDHIDVVKYDNGAN